MTEGGELTLIRRAPLRMEGARDVCPPGWLRRSALGEAWRLAALLRRGAARPRPSRNRSRELFAVLVFQLWYDRWQSKPPANGS